MATAVAKVRKEVITYEEEFIIDSSVETIVNVEDNKDGTVTLHVLSYLRKGNGA